jgi:hypothetical protein
MSRVGRRRALAGLGIAGLATGSIVLFRKPYPSDHTPAGAYQRLARSFGEDKVQEAFAYIETEAQWACYSIRDARRDAVAIVRARYPEDRRQEALAPLEAAGACADGSDVFALYSRTHGFRARMRKDLSGVASVDTAGERATVITARGTRYPFRKRDNGIWGLTIFTAELLAEKDRATRDLGLIQKAADDYARAGR